MIQKNLLKLALVALTAGLFISAQSTQACKEVPPVKKEVAVETTAQELTTDVAEDQNEVAMMKGSVGGMQKFDSQDNCNKSAPCKTCNECTPAKPCKTCSECTPARPCKKCEPKACTPAKKCNSCNKCDETKPCGKGVAKTAVEG